MTANRSREPAGGGKSRRAFRTIGEVSAALDLPQHVLRFWETRFPQIRPLKRGGNRRYYRPEDVDLLRAIRSLLHEEGYTIKGVQKRFREQGVKATVEAVLEPARRDRPAPAGEDRPPPARIASPAGGPDRALAELREELVRLRRLLD